MAALKSILAVRHAFIASVEEIKSIGVKVTLNAPWMYRDSENTSVRVFKNYREAVAGTHPNSIYDSVNKVDQWNNPVVFEGMLTLSVQEEAPVEIKVKRTRKSPATTQPKARRKSVKTEV